MSRARGSLSLIDHPIGAHPVSKEEKVIPVQGPGVEPGIVPKMGRLFLDSEILPRIKKGEHFTTLFFNSHPPSQMYHAEFIKEYINELDRYDFFRYIAFLENGDYRGWMKASTFITMVNKNGDEAATWINNGNYERLRKEGMHTASLDRSKTAQQAYDFLSNSNEEAVAILEFGRLIGIASRDGIAGQLLAKPLVR